MRDVQQSLIDPTLERPVGPIPMSVVTGNNTDLIASIAPLYLTGSVLDVTYGRGGWWKRFTPKPFTFHDLTLDGVDFRALPELDNSVDAVCYDPPYVPAGGAGVGEPDYRDRFGLTARSEQQLGDLIADGLSEVARVARTWVLAKCNDYVNGRMFILGHLKMIDEASKHGLRVHDLIIHASGTGPGGHNIYTPLRSRRAHSYLIVFRKKAR